MNWFKDRFNDAKRKAEQAKREVEKKARWAKEKAERAKREAEKKAREAKEYAERKAREAKRKAEEEFNKKKKEAERKAREAKERLEREARKAKEELERKGKYAISQIEKGGKEALDRIEDACKYVGMSPEDLIKKVAKQVKDEVKEHVVDEVKDIVTKDIPNIVKKGIPDIAENVVTHLQRQARDKVIKEIEEFGKDRVLRMSKVAIDEAIELNKSNPMDSFSVSAGVAGNGIELGWDGREQSGEILETIRDAIKDNKITAKEIGEIVYVSLPSSITITQGGTITIALILGVEVEIGFSQTYTKEGVRTFIENFENNARKTFYEIPKKVIEAGFGSKD